MFKEFTRDLAMSFACAFGVGLGWQASKKAYAFIEKKASEKIEERKAAEYNANNG